LIYATTTDGQNLTIVLEGQRTVPLGSTLPAFVDPTKGHLFDAQDNALPRA
jgi:multiple sugar transport system ATP-binding protein